MKTLDEIAIEHQTDKATRFTRTYARPKGYTVHFAKFFEPLRDKPIKLLEIGVGGGESIRTWLEYFPISRIYGIDNVQATNAWNTVRPRDPGPEKIGVWYDRYTFVYGDQTDPTFWKCFAVDYGADWDIIIDDGAHSNDATIISFNGLWSLLKPGGLYCIEDLATAYGGDSYFVKPGYPNQIDWLKLMIDALNLGAGEVDSIYFSRELAILTKQPCTPSSPTAAPVVTAASQTPAE